METKSLLFYFPKDTLVAAYKALQGDTQITSVAPELVSNVNNSSRGIFLFPRTWGNFGSTRHKYSHDRVVLNSGICRKLPFDLYQTLSMQFRHRFWKVPGNLARSSESYCVLGFLLSFAAFSGFLFTCLLRFQDLDSGWINIPGKSSPFSQGLYTALTQYGKKTSQI